MNMLEGRGDTVKVNSKRKFIISVVVGVLTVFVMMLLLLSVMTALILNGKLNSGNEAVIMVGVHFLTMLVGCVVSGLIADKAIYACVGTLIIALLVNLTITIFTFSGAFRNMVSSLLSDAGGCLIAIWLATMIKNKSKAGLKKYRSR